MMILEKDLPLYGEEIRKVSMFVGGIAVAESLDNSKSR